MSSASQRLRQVRRARADWRRRGALASGLLALWAVSAWFAPAPAPDAASPRPGETAAMRELRLCAAELRAALVPELRQAALQRARGKGEALAHAVEQTLRAPTHALFAAACELAALLPIDDAAAKLGAAANAAEGAALGAAWQALELLEPIDESRLAEALAAESAELAEAALGLLAARQQQSPETTQALLGYLAQAKGRAAAMALRCLPAELDGKFAAAALDLCAERPTDAMAAELLTRLAPDAELAASVAELVAAAEEAQAQRLAPALRRLADQPAVQAALWDFALGDAAIELRGMALSCLGAASAPVPIPPQAASLPPQLACRRAELRLHNGDLGGLDELLTLAASEPDDNEPLRAAASCARVLLSQRAKLPPHAPLEDFRAWRKTALAAPLPGR
jgi:hypothetical protein